MKHGKLFFSVAIILLNIVHHALAMENKTVTVETHDSIFHGIKRAHLLPSITIQTMLAEFDFEPSTIFLPIPASLFTILLPLLKKLSKSHQGNNSYEAIAHKIDSYNRQTLCSLLTTTDRLEIPSLTNQLLIKLSQVLIQHDELVQFIKDPIAYCNSLEIIPPFTILLTKHLITEDSLWYRYFLKNITPIDIQCLSSFTNNICFSPDSNMIAIPCFDNTIQLWNAHTHTYDEPLVDKPDSLITNYSNKLHIVCFSPNGKYLASVLSEKIQLWDINTKQCLATLNEQSDKIHNLYFTPNSKHLVCAIDDTIKIWETDTNILVHTLNHPGWPTYVALSVHNTHIASAIGNTIRVWELLSGKQIYTLHHDQAIYEIYFNKNGTHLISCSDDKTVKIWDITTGLAMHTLYHPYEVPTMAISPNDMFIATGSIDETITIWHAHSGKPIHTLMHEKPIHTLCFSPDNKYLAGSAYNSTIKIWNVSTGNLLCTLTNSMKTKTINFSSDGKYLGSTTLTGESKLWDFTQLFNDVTTLSLPTILLLHALENNITNWEQIKNNADLKTIFQSFPLVLQDHYQQKATMTNFFVEYSKQWLSQ